MDAKKAGFFRKQLMHWHREHNTRMMPWKAEKDPYKIWISEIILQQTRVEQGLSYYENFIKTYPKIELLAAAPEAAVFKLWEGLGYYSRCKNLLATARFISGELSGIFPNRYEDIIALKGIGPYTAAAIASFAFNLPHAVVDGNVMRVLARYAAEKIPIDSTEGKKYFNKLAQQLLDAKEPALYNQAIMDLGATICKPQQPRCAICPVNKQCSAFAEGKVNDYPVKQNKLVKKDRWFYYIVASYRGQWFIRRRSEKDIWENLHEFILLENKKAVKPSSVLASDAFKEIAGEDHKLVHISKAYRQQLTHQTIHGHFIHVELKNKTTIEGYELLKKSYLGKLAFPRFITAYFSGEGKAFLGPR